MERLPPALDPQSHTWLELGQTQRLLLDSYPGLVLGLDLQGRISWVNPAGAERLGYGREELSGREVAGNLIAREELERRAAELTRELEETIAGDAGVLGARLRRGAASDESDWPLRRRDGTAVATRLAVGALRDHAGAVTGLIAVEPWPRLEEGAEVRLTNFDSLTGLPARAVLPDRLEMALQRAARQKTVVGLLLVELAGFEMLCEQHGHSVCDDVLRATASRLYFELRKTDTAVRLEGGRFAAMLVDLHQSDEAVLVANKVHKGLSAPVNVGVAVIPLAARVGVAWFPSHGDQLLPLLQAAEAALGSVGGELGGVAIAPPVAD